MKKGLELPPSSTEQDYPSILAGRVANVVTVHDDLLTQWRYIYMSKFCGNIFLIQTTSNYLWASEVSKNQGWCKFLIVSIKMIIASKLTHVFNLGYYFLLGRWKLNKSLLNLWFLKTSEACKSLEVVCIKKILAWNLLIYISLHCVRRSLWIVTTLATLSEV